MESYFILVLLVSMSECHPKVVKEQYHENQEEKRIVDGKDARTGGFPWQVSIYYEGKLICGGTLISVQYVMTAAHCFGPLDEDNLYDYQVKLGEKDRKVTDEDQQERNIFSVKKHEDYKTGDIHANDIAIITLKTNATKTSRIFPACLPKTNIKLHAGDRCVLTGWGRDYAWGDTSRLLKELSTPIVSLAECRRLNQRGGTTVSYKMLCTGEQDKFSSGCMGDSGGPLSCIERDTRKWKVYGVVSWGSTQCNGLDRYTVYTKVREYLVWIYANSKVVPRDDCYREDP